ncbi:DNA topoisomerase I, mitochondrial isoform X1 [Epinephelus moara]|uniref:DNA topoisomerase I, mitochondrial isoform X1 n=1 Tax=Epinephelus moara TaxID=300413 RepID=UPI00214EC0B9|nr:DNA topoisomerase I, mitochondrial isoform X1 [Epinephelus moara]XP_049930181.1 DNA topoisomerase I, mitochondrial isoform X1 [Epinephelus moara]XP_049930182.1 DNA topoisomerase I, mitochondrial isoform X1 [Epinephelus moara]XP_049930183.1 DNA topoisomerase I, mitochondrial isoform X1 [Epinephelus moara]XP_049930185.1 DNA topoisomerase I, mitochondrial isoform X1 [Epinephelus moara]XP_049930186.1 DNA topoisomerase I, mitochondrial isoform X1 [Epinephelus moara]XP_049930187.1 DNA topoisomer
MGREKDVKGEVKAKHKAMKLKRLSDNESAGAWGDTIKNNAKLTKSTEKTDNGKSHKKVKTPKTDTLESPSSPRESVKQEPEDDDFTAKKKGMKRKRVKDEPMEGPSHSTATPTSKKKNKRHKQEEESDVEIQNKKSKKRTEKAVKREEGEHPVSKKPKRTKEEIDEARQLKIKKKEEEEQNRWRWWEEEKYEDGVKWKFLEHNGPYFPPEYQPLPDDVHFYYAGKEVKLSLAAEEVAFFFGQMLDHEYTTKKVFRENFFKDWRKEMTHEERSLIKDLDKCDFGEIHAMHKAKVEARKNMTKEEKLVLKEANQKIVDEYGYCLLDHHKERIGNFKIEPPGLFRGRGEHPKQGMLKKRIQPEDVIINCSKEARIPVPPTGHRWKEVRHDNTVTWLASWTENIQGSIKYIMLNANSKLKGEKDWEKYEVARKLKSCVDDIRNQYMQDLKSKQMGTRQRAVALYFIDKLALRAGNEKEEGETADTVGCCSLRVEHITLHEQLEGNECVVEFDFLGKDSIRYYNKVPVIRKVFKNLKLFLENKQPGDDLFDRLNTAMLNKHLSSLMTGLTAKVFRTYNASITLQQQLKELTNKSDNAAEKLLSYNRANRAVAILCNHQRAPPKTFDQSMANLQAKIDAQKEKLALAKTELKQAKKEAKTKGSSDPKLQTLVERKKTAVKRCEEQLLKLEVQATDREENKQIALGTSKLNYLDPRISVAWCKNVEVPVEKIYNKSQRDKFAWAIDMTEADFEF